VTDEGYEFELNEIDGVLVLDWGPVVNGIMDDIARSLDHHIVATRFHNGLAGAVVKVAKAIGTEKVVLSGGCFQNQYLTEKTIELLQTAGFTPYWPVELPPGDGALSVGQLTVAAARLERN
jgi:hydrogenase maturation protein HypF